VSPATESVGDSSTPSCGLVVAVLFLLWLSFIPGINNLGQVLVIVVLAALAVVGIEILRRQTAREFPRARDGT
jgi:hypothetical protein